MLTSLWLMLSMGLLGSLHCVGMCGGLVSALGMSQPRVWWAGLASYQAGRLTTYALLGVSLGLLGGLLGGFGSLAPRLLALLAGGVMVVIGLHLLGWVPDPLRRLTEAARGPVGLTQLTSVAARFPTHWRWYSMGLANGLLPCGLVVAALGLSLAEGDPLKAGGMMLTFGIGTVPAMMLAPAAVRRFSPSLRGKGVRLLGALVLLLGLLTMLRGVH